MSDFLSDVRHGIRRLTKSPSFTLIAIVTLALGVGANTTVFSIVNSMLLRPLPYSDSGRLVTLNHIYPAYNVVSGVSAPGFRDYQDRTQSFERLGITRHSSAVLTGVDEPARIVGSEVSIDYFRTYGTAPALGRTFHPEEYISGNQHVLVISDGFWKLRLGGDPDVLERSILLDDESYQVVGVMPAEFEDFFGRGREFWRPIVVPAEELGEGEWFTERQQLVARLKPDVSLEMAAREMANLAETVKSELSFEAPPGWTIRVTSLHDKKTAGYRATLSVLFGAVGFVLLITCANIANLLLVRAIGRQKEIAIRKALGASRGQVIRQLFAESLVLSLVGGATGLVIAYWSVGALVGLGPDMLANTEIVIDLRVLLFTLSVALASGMLFGLVPAIQGTRGDLQGALRAAGPVSSSGRRGQQVQRLLIVGEVAVALVLLTGSGLMIRTISQLRQIDPGFDPDHVLAARVELPEARYPDATSRIAFYDQLLSELSAKPGISAVATTHILPFGGSWHTSRFSIENYIPDDNSPRTWGDIRTVSPGFIRAMEIPLLEGRFFDLSDGPESPLVAVVDEEFAGRFWPDESPIGKRLTFDDPTDPDARWQTVIGVVGHTLHRGLDDDIRVQLYSSSRQFWDRDASLLIRTDTDPEAMVQTVRQTVFSIDQAQPIFGIRILETLIAESIGNRQFLRTLLTLFSGLAVLLASIGVYGIMAQMVRERSRELRLRMALGATRPGLFSLVIKNGLTLAGAGMVVGVGGSLMLTRLMENQLFGVETTDPVTLVVVAGILLSVAVLAICLPAHRAARLDPVENLMTE